MAKVRAWDSGTWKKEEPGAKQDPQAGKQNLWLLGNRRTHQEGSSLHGVWKESGLRSRLRNNLTKFFKNQTLWALNVSSAAILQRGALLPGRPLSRGDPSCMI